jgi:hypothetical protein
MEAENVPFVVIDEKTTENQSNAEANVQANNLEFGEEIRKMLGTAGTLELNETQNKALYSPVEDSDVLIKPDGLIYLSWIKYSGKLTKAFTGTGWAMIPQGMPKIQNNLIVWGFHLVIKGIYCGFAIGEQQYFDNGRMTFGEACEGAKSNALMRLCKGLGIGLELWDKSFIDRWVSKYADKKWDSNANNGQGKYFWSLKPNAFGTSTPTPTPQANNTPVVAKTDANKSAEVKTPVAQKGKIGENTEFLEQKNDKVTKGKKAAEVPIVAMDDSEPLGEEKDLLAKYTTLLESSKTNVQLKANYDTVKKSFEKGEITEEKKETLRKLANQLFLKLSQPQK